MKVLPNTFTTRPLQKIAVSAALFVAAWSTQKVSAQEMPTPSAPSTATKVLKTTTQAITSPNRIGFIISPPQVELSGKPGEVLQVSLKVKNVSDQTQTFRSETFDYIVGADGSTPQEVSENVPNRWSAKRWITLSPSTAVIPANISQTITALIQIPADALPGGHYAMVLHTPNVAEKSEKKNVATVESRAGTLLYITVAGDIREEAFINNIKAPTWVEYGPVEVSYKVDNQSDVHIAPSASMTVRDMFGRVMAINKIPEKNIFPYLSKEFQSTYDAFWGFGRYTATIEAAYGKSGKLAKGVVQFWILPYRLILALLVGSFSLLAILIAIRRHIQHRNSLQTKQIEVLEERIRELEGRNTERKKRE